MLMTDDWPDDPPLYNKFYPPPPRPRRTSFDGQYRRGSHRHSLQYHPQYARRHPQLVLQARPLNGANGQPDQYVVRQSSLPTTPTHYNPRAPVFEPSPRSGPQSPTGVYSAPSRISPSPLPSQLPLQLSSRPPTPESTPTTESPRFSR